MVGECQTAHDDEPAAAEFAQDAEEPAGDRPAPSFGTRFTPVAARALALAGFASLILCDSPTRTISVTLH